MISEKFLNRGVLAQMFWILILCAGIFTGCGFMGTSGGKADVNSVWLDEGDVNGSTLKVRTRQGEYVFDIEIADTSEQRAQGLMYRKSMKDNHGMFFIFDDDGTKNFWMKNTLFPLDMVFFDNNYRIVHIHKNAQPCKTQQCEVIPSVKPARYVLEIVGGTAERLGINEGDTAEVKL